VEGQVRINGQAVTNQSVGTADVSAGQTAETGQGKAEFLLTPGVFLRLGENTRIQMDSTGLTDTRFTVLNGKTFVEADNLQPQNNIEVGVSGSVARLEKNGMYQFEEDPPRVAVFDGKAQVTEDGHNVNLGKGQEVTPDTALKKAKFDRVSDESDPLYRWSAVRSEYLAEADLNQAQRFAYGGAGWYGSGWYWDPWWSMYAWVPGDGIFYSPFGWGFYSPFTVWAAPVYVHGYHGFHGYPGGHVPVVGQRGFRTAPSVSGGFAHGGSAHSGFGSRR
jgi:hypothetical protein